jgi:hypothetical protein
MRLHDMYFFLLFLIIIYYFLHHIFTPKSYVENKKIAVCPLELCHFISSICPNDNHLLQHYLQALLPAKERM